MQSVRHDPLDTATNRGRRADTIVVETEHNAKESSTNAGFIAMHPTLI